MDLQVPSTSDGEFISQEALVSENLRPKEPWPCEGKPKLQSLLLPFPALAAQAAGSTSLGCGDPIGSLLSLT